MANLREEVPAEFSDDERWYKYFTKKTLVVLLIAILFTYVLTVLFGLIHLPALGLFIGIIIGSTVFIAFNVKLPISDTLHGGGTTLDVLFVRIMVRRKTGKIMVRYNEHVEENFRDED